MDYTVNLKIAIKDESCGGAYHAYVQNVAEILRTCTEEMLHRVYAIPCNSNKVHVGLHANYIDVKRRHRPQPAANLQAMQEVTPTLGARQT